MSTQSNILSVRIKDRSSLYNAYMPFIKNGGLFVPTNKPFHVGDEVFVLLFLYGETGRLPLSTRVVWKSPSNPVDNKPPGIGIKFDESDAGTTREIIESKLIGILASPEPTNTV